MYIYIYIYTPDAEHPPGSRWPRETDPGVMERHNGGSSPRNRNAIEKLGKQTHKVVLHPQPKLKKYPCITPPSGAKILSKNSYQTL